MMCCDKVAFVVQSYVLRGCLQSYIGTLPAGWSSSSPGLQSLTLNQNKFKGMHTSCGEARQTERALQESVSSVTSMAVEQLYGCCMPLSPCWKMQQPAANDMCGHAGTLPPSWASLSLNNVFLSQNELTGELSQLCLAE